METTEKPLKVLLAVDKISTAEAAVNLTTHISWSSDTTLHLLASVPKLLPYGAMAPVGQNGANGSDSNGNGSNGNGHYPSQLDWITAKQHALETVRLLKTQGLTVDTEVYESDLLEGVFSRAAELDVDLIIVSPSALENNGTLTRKLVDRAPCSILIARPSRLVRPLNTLLMVDETTTSFANLDLLCRLSLPNWAKVTVVSVVGRKQQLAAGVGPTRRYVSTAEPPCDTCRIIGQLERCGVRVWRDFQTESTGVDVLTAINREEADLVIVDQHHGQQSVVEERLMGYLINDTACSVLVVKE